MGWNAPNHYPPWPTFHGEAFAAVGLSVLFLSMVWPLPIGTHGRTDPLRGTLALPHAAYGWLLVSMLPVMQFVLGQLAFRGDAAIGLLYGLGVAISIYTGYLWAVRAGSDRVVRALFTTLVIGGLVANGLALAQWTQLAAVSWWAMELIGTRPFANLGQPNHFGLLMVMSIVAATGLFEASIIRHRWIYRLALVFFGWGVLISQSRASVAALIAIAVCWVLTCRRLPTRLCAREILVAVAALLLLYGFLGSIEGALRLTVNEVRSPLEAGPRQWIWLHFWTAILERPWTGYGFNQGVLALAEVASAVHPSRNTTYAHNIVLDLMTWFGIPLAVILCLAFARWTLGLLRKMDSARLMAQRHQVFALWLALIVQSLLEFPFAHAYFLLIAALLVGAVTQIPERADGANADRSFVASWRALGAGTLGFALLVVVSIDYMRIETDFRSNRFERANFIGQPAHVPRSEPWVLDHLAALNAGAHREIKAGMSDAQLEQMRLVARRFHFLFTRMDYAKALALNGRLDQAEEELRIIRSIYHPVTYQLIEREWNEWLRQHHLVHS